MLISHLDELYKSFVFHVKMLYFSWFC